MPTLPTLENKDYLLQFLREEFAYCGCGYYEEALRDLRDLLDFARRRQEALSDDLNVFHTVTNELNDWLLLAPGLSTWFVWLLDERKFIWHGIRTSDCYLSEKGRVVLDAINKFYEFDD